MQISRISQRDWSRVDLLALLARETVLRRVATTHGGEYAGPCPFCGGRDRFRVWPQHPQGKGRWWCRGCGRNGDAITYLREREGLSYAEACQALTRFPRQRLSTCAPVAPRVTLPEPSVPPSETWQTQCWEALAECQAALDAPVGDKARAWLRQRGLRESSWIAAGLGYNARDQKRHGLYVPRGILIPGFCGTALWYLKVRRPVPPISPPKYTQVKGGRPTLFGVDSLTGKPVVVLCEGEFDALLLWQETHDLIDVVAVGGAGQHLTPHILAPLVHAPQWWLAFDQDQPGNKGAAWWTAFSARVRVVRPPSGNDLTDFHVAGGDLRAWVQGLLTELVR